MDASKRYCYNPTLRWNPSVEEYFVKAYGGCHFSRISEALTRPSCYSCIRVNTLKSTSGTVIKKLLSIIQDTWHVNAAEDCEWNKCDAIAKIGMGEIKAFKEFNIRQTLNHSNSTPVIPSEDVCPLMENCRTAPAFKCQLPGLDYVVFLRGSGPHSIEYGYEDDGPLKEVIVSRKCAEAVLRGAQVYVPGVLACSAHVEKGDTVAVSVAVEQPTLDGGWAVGMTRGTVLQGSHTGSHHVKRNGLYIGLGTAMMSRTALFRVSEGLAIDMNRRVFDLPSLHDVLKGEIFLQNLPSIITAHALDPQPGERILDMCAAPGGKTTAIAILMKDEGVVVAADRSHNKVLDIEKLAVEMGLNCITTYKLDALRAVSLSKESGYRSSQACQKDSMYEPIQSANSLEEQDKNISDSILLEGSNTDQTCMTNVCGTREDDRRYTSKRDLRKSTRRQKNGPGRNQSLGGRVNNSNGFCPNSFDRVLLDAPCSALGLRPRLFAGEVTVESLRNHAKYQRKMFDQAVQLVRPGGVLVYSTCTINPGENEALVRYALDTYNFLSLAEQNPRIGGPGLIGSCCFADGSVEEWLRDGEEELVQRFDPSAPLDTIGFFIAKFNVGCKDGPPSPGNP